MSQPTWLAYEPAPSRLIRGLLMGYLCWVGTAGAAQAQTNGAGSIDTTLQVGTAPSVTIPINQSYTLTAGGYYIQGLAATKITQLELSRAVIPRLKITAGYLGIYLPKVGELRNNYDHRIRVSATATGNVQRLLLTYRVLGEYRFRQSGSGYRFRNRLELAYPLPRQKPLLIPYVFSEVFYDGNTGRFDSDYVTAGLRKPIGKNVTIDASFGRFHTRRNAPVYLLFAGVLYAFPAPRVAKQPPGA